MHRALTLTPLGPGAAVDLRWIEARVATVSDLVVEEKAVRTQLLGAHAVATLEVFVTLAGVREILHALRLTRLTRRCKETSSDLVNDGAMRTAEGHV